MARRILPPLIGGFLCGSVAQIMDGRSWGPTFWYGIGVIIVTMIVREIQDAN